MSAAVEDVRALWANPAGLGVAAGASLFGEAALERASPGNWALGQYSIGMSSRGLGVGYQRDRLPPGGSVGTWRLGWGVSLGPRGALGTTVAFHKPDRGYDIGVRLAPLNSVHLAAAVRNIGRPTAGDSTLPLSGVAGILWRVPGSVVQLGADLRATERRSGSGYGVSYRTGAQITAPGPWAVTGLVVLDVGSSIRRWSVGVIVGRQYQAALVGSVAPATASAPSLDAVSVAGVASRRLAIR